MTRTLLTLVLWVITAPLASIGAQTAPTLAGVVHDSAGRPVVGVEVILRDANIATRTNDRGELIVTAPAAGAYQAWFRRLGYTSVQYNWAARAGERTQIEVVMTEIAKTLDPVVVRADEDKRMRVRASILGLVIDSLGLPIPEAEVQLVGADMNGTTRQNGGFLFRPLNVGAYVIRVRKLGYAPSTVTLQLVEGDDREVVVRMRSLAQGLDPVVVTERSGYGRDQRLYDELERRKRWVNFQNHFLGPEDLKGFYGATLDVGLIRMGLNGPGLATAKAARPVHLDPGGTSGRRELTIPGDACILLNGKTPLKQPLWTFNTDDVELLEVYPGGTELTGTVSDHFFQPGCTAASRMIQPNYYVLWLKNP